MKYITQEDIRRLGAGEVATSEIRGLLHAGGFLLRANALMALVRQARNEEWLVDELRGVAIATENQQARLIGTMTVAHLAVGGLLEVGGERAVEIAQSLISSWPEADQTDFHWFLKTGAFADLYRP